MAKSQERGENKIAPWGSRNGGDDARGDFRGDDGDLANDLAEGRGVRWVCEGGRKMSGRWHGPCRLSMRIFVGRGNGGEIGGGWRRSRQRGKHEIGQIGESEFRRWRGGGGGRREA